MNTKATPERHKRQHNVVLSNHNMRFHVANGRAPSIIVAPITPTTPARAQQQRTLSTEHPGKIKPCNPRIALLPRPSRHHRKPASQLLVIHPNPSSVHHEKTGMSKSVKSTCCYCGVGCGILINTNAQGIVDVVGDPEHPANFGRLCTKGSTLALTYQLSERALYPELRHDRNAVRGRTDWDTALDYTAERFAAIIAEHGPDSVAFYISGQLMTEDYYVFNKLAKGLIGTNNVDTNSRLCMSSAVAGYKTTLGADAPPACYEDIALTECLLIAGANMAFAHPILFRRIEDAKTANPQLKIIVVDPRRTDTAASADLHLPILPGSDVTLYNAMLHVLLWEGLTDNAYIRAHTEGFDALKETVREYTPEMAATICGVPAADIVQAARWFGDSASALSFYCMGLNQSSQGTEKNAAVINLHLATGKIGKPGSGPFSLTGQPNAMGGREVGGMANLLSAHRDLANPEHRAEVAQLWGVPDVPATPGTTAVEMFDAIAAGKIKAVWIACTNPAQSMPNQNLVHRALAAAELVVVQETYAHTDTVEFADVLLPASSWAEKHGTVTNSERRITHVNQALPTPGAARHDWDIIVDFARRLETRLGNGRVGLFPYAGVEDIFNEHRATTRGRDLDITGLSYALLDERGPQLWPFPEGATGGTPRLYSDGVFATANGRAKFANTVQRKLVEDTDARYPFHLTTGRLRDQWHCMSRTGIVARLYNHEEEPYLWLNPEDMSRHGYKNGEIVRAKSRRGEMLIRLQSSDSLRPLQCFMPMHWGGQFMSNKGPNTLTVGDFDPTSKQPELKHAAIRLDKVELPWEMVVMRLGGGARHLSAVQPLLQRFDYATVTLFGRDVPGVILRAHGQTAPPAELIHELDRLLEMDDEAMSMVYVDKKRGISKRVLVSDSNAILGVRLTGETLARDWLKDLMISGSTADTVRPWVLAPVASPPTGSNARGKIICNCWDVSDKEITQELSQGADLAAVQQKLKCGTQCGSCLPEVKRLVASFGAVKA